LTKAGAHQRRSQKIGAQKPSIRGLLEVPFLAQLQFLSCFSVFPSYSPGFPQLVYSFPQFTVSFPQPPTQPLGFTHLLGIIAAKLKFADFL
jgi:hypothetical protein